MLAVKNENLEMVKTLLAMNAQTGITTPAGATVFDFVREDLKPASSGQSIKDLLLGLIGARSAPIGGKSVPNQILEELVMGWEFELDNKAAQAFFRQIQEGNLPVIDLTLKRGLVPVDITTRSGLTPLMLAVRLNNAKLFELLISHGADPTMATPDGETALTLAQKQNNPRIINRVNAAMSSFGNS